MIFLPISLPPAQAVIGGDGVNIHPGLEGPEAAPICRAVGVVGLGKRPPTTGANSVDQGVIDIVSASIADCHQAPEQIAKIMTEVASTTL